MRHTWVWLVAASMLVRVPIPLAPEAFSSLATAQLVLLAGAALAWAVPRYGPRAVPVAVAAFTAGLLVEGVGSRTGVPFGEYSYAGAPSPLIAGVPLLVPLGWFSIVLAAHVHSAGRWWLTGLLTVAWDIALEPLMTREGYWQWAPGQGPSWYGAPVVNFLAWFAVGALLSVLFSRTLRPAVAPGSLAWVYRLEAWFLPAGLALLGLWPAALASAGAMNALDVVRLARRHTRRAGRGDVTRPAERARPRNRGARGPGGPRPRSTA